MTRGSRAPLQRSVTDDGHVETASRELALDPVQLGDVVIGSQADAVTRRLVGERALLHLRFPAGERETGTQVLRIRLADERARLEPETLRGLGTGIDGGHGVAGLRLVGGSGLGG